MIYLVHHDVRIHTNIILILVHFSSICNFAFAQENHPQHEHANNYLTYKAIYLLSLLLNKTRQAGRAGIVNPDVVETYKAELCRQKTADGSATAERQKNHNQHTNLPFA